MTRVMNILLLACLVFVGHLWYQEASRLEYAVEEAQRLALEARIELEKSRDESTLLRAVVMANLSRIADPIPNKMLTVTAYTSVELTPPTMGEQILTASLARPKEGMVAVSRDLFKQGWVFGKKVYIKNHGIFIITDVMGQSKLKSVDIYMNDYDRALQFGKKQIEVVLLDV